MEARPPEKNYKKKMRKQIQTAILNIPEFEYKPQANYKPRVSAKHLCQLWAVKRNTGKPITKLVAEAIDLYLKTVSLPKEGGDTNATYNQSA
ncbi:hypothetical protein ACFLZ1_01175 [Patescibacteria group bacterium]